MKIAIILLVWIGSLIYISEPSISFSPFKIHFEKPALSFAWFFLIIAVLLFQYQSDKTGHLQGVTDTLDIIKKEVLDKKQNNKN